jgi:glycerate 2-kinase
MLKMKKIILAPDSFKGTMSAITICGIAERVIKRFFPDAEIINVPIADGGEGTCDCFFEALGGEKIDVKVSGPFFEKVDSFYLLLPDKKTAVIEMSAAAGLPLAGDKKNPAITTTFGVGELILHVLKKGVKKIILGLGGSATNDGGAGMAAALGIKFFDNEGKDFIPTGGTLEKITKIDFSDKLKQLDDCAFIAMCDVNNPICGTNGAAYIFAPQKGADPEMVKTLDENLLHFSKIILAYTGKDILNIPGTGAAGGMGAGVLAFLTGELKSGIETVLDTVGFDELLEGADLVITGEGRIDSQSLSGKAVIGVARRAKKKNVPVVAVCGGIEDDIMEVYNEGVSAVFSINRKPLPFSEARLFSEKNLELTIDSLMRVIKNINKGDCR